MVVICQGYCKKSQILAMCIKNMRKSRILRRKMHHKGDAKIGIKLKKDYEICTNGKCQKRVRNLTKKQDVLESSKRNLFFE